MENRSFNFHVYRAKSQEKQKKIQQTVRLPKKLKKIMEAMADERQICYAVFVQNAIDHFKSIMQPLLE